MKRQTRYPDYFKDFACIGPECEDTCCHQWKIIVDRNTYRQYQTITDPELQPVIKEFLKPNTREQNAGNFGLIKLNSQQRCPFLSTVNLCLLQQKLGVTALSQTCLTYPRIFHCIDDIIEASAEISCPEVARKALLNRAGISLKTTVIELDDRYKLNASINLEQLSLKYPVANYFFRIREFAISVIKNRSRRLADRLIILGMLSQKVQELTVKVRTDEIPALLDYFNEQIRLDSFRTDLSKIPVNAAIQMTLLKELADTKIARGTGIKAYGECHTQFLKGIAYGKEVAIDEITASYKAAHDNYYEPYIHANEHILENYCVNYLFRNLFPFLNQRSYENIFNAYVALILNYSMLKMYLIGLAGYYNELNDPIVIKMIYSFGKAIEHDNSYLKNVFAALQKNGYTSLGHMAILIKN